MARRRISRIMARIFCALAFSCGSPAAFPANTSGNYGDLLLFPELTQLERFEVKDPHKIPEDYFNPGLNLFYTFDRERFRFLLEWLFDRSSQEVQRLQLGWRVQDTTFWVGRFHNPIGYWNTRFHHGSYLMTSISRPGAMTYETTGGPLPTHLTGLYVEGTQEIGDSSLYYVLNAGAGPNLLQTRLDAFDVLEGGGNHRPGVTLRLGYQPTSFGPNEFGASFSYTELPGEALGVQAVKQIVAGAYANWREGDFGLLGETLLIHNQLQGGHSQPVVVNMYGQGEWRAADKLTLFGRVEGTFNADGDAYLDHFGKFVRERYMGGLRYELPYNMALKVELSRDRIKDDSYGQVGMQWSAVFP
jgi:hypothetical protein